MKQEAIHFLEVLKNEDDKQMKIYFKKYYSICVGTLMRDFECDEDTANKCYIDVFADIWEKTQKGRQLKIDSLQAYLKSASYKKMLSVLRKQNGKRTIQTTSISGREDFLLQLPEEDDEISQQLSDNVNTVLNQMGEKCRSILIKRYFLDWEVEDIAEEFGYDNNKAASSKIYKCKKEFRKLLIDLYKKL
jgi:RNA polymerase sigma factor (sigma-70 family)